MAILKDRKKRTKHILHDNKQSIKRLAKSIFWFISGSIVGFFFFISFLFITYKVTHRNKVYDGVKINNIDFGGKTQNQVWAYFTQKNKAVGNTKFILTSGQLTATLSAKQIGFGYDRGLLAEQAMSIGRASDMVSNSSLIVQAYFNTINLPPAGTYKEAVLNSFIAQIYKKLNIAPVNGLFSMDDGKVVSFQQAQNGQTINVVKLQTEIIHDLRTVILQGQPRTFLIKIPIEQVKPTVNNDNAEKLGIKDLLGEGSSLFEGSIQSRIYNITLAASRLNGVLIPPNQIFSFDETIGDISQLTGYEQAYVIDNGHTVLGDGGGVCQVSTTLFRAALNAGLPITERHQHAYRVGYYEEDSPPGIDAAIYYPTVDLKFDNDTGHYILIQSSVDPATDKITFDLYGTSDGRISIVNTPVIVSQTPAPPAKYIPDPQLPKGQLQQTDFAAGGADVYFTRTVWRQGQEILSDKFTSDYQPWQAVYLQGTE